MIGCLRVREGSRRDSNGTEILMTYLSHATINYEICPINKAALIAGKEEHRLSLLNGFTEATSREMDLAAMALRCVVTKPILQKRCTVDECQQSVSCNIREPPN